MGGDGAAAVGLAPDGEGPSAPPEGSLPPVFHVVHECDEAELAAVPQRSGERRVIELVKQELPRLDG